MSEHTAIEWTDSTFNPWTGCTKVSPGCDHCYAEGWSKRAGEKVGKWGPGAPRVRTTPANWRKPLAWNRDAAFFVECIDCGRRGDARTWLDDIKRTLPNAIGCCPDQRLRPARRRVFCASLADVFDNEVPIEWLVDFLELACIQTPNLDKLCLTKRIGNVIRRLTDALAFLHARNRSKDDALIYTLTQWLRGEPPPGIWLGATVVNQEEADRDVPKLLAVPARVRFLSVEPLLGPLDLLKNDDTLCRCGGCLDMAAKHPEHAGLQRIDWVIVGGESGPHARPMHPDWVRSLRDQCQAAGAAFFMKQWGEWREPTDSETFTTALGRAQKTPAFIVAPTGTVHCFENDQTKNGGTAMLRVGKKAAGRLLDGRTWDQFPEVSHV